MKYGKPKEVELIYFSGTGGTKRVADVFESELMRNGITVSRYEIDCHNRYTPQATDLLILLYPVYALNAPEPVYKFIRKLPVRNACPAVVISVSGGGEVTPNLACRLHTIRRLKEKGYRTVYEDMLVMPSNVLIPTPEPLAGRLLAVLPCKAEHIIHDILNGVTRRTKPNWVNRTLACFGELEKSRFGGKLFGRHIHVNSNCNGCGICQRNCPMKNIVLKDKVPVFGRRCSLCLKCIYECPRKALIPEIGRFFILKDGYRLKAYEGRSTELNYAELRSLTRGYALSGIRKYLLEDNGCRRFRQNDR